MSFAGSGQRDIGGQLTALQDEFGAFAVRERTVEVSRTGLADVLSTSGRCALGGARALIEHDGDALLVKDDEGRQWDAPGGSRDADEAYVATAQRYVYETTGIESAITTVHLVHRCEFTLVEGTDGATGLWILFGGETADPALDVSDGVADARWFADPPDATASDVREQIVD